MSDATPRSLAKDAYVFAFPMLEAYKTMYFQSVARNSPMYRMAVDQYYRGDKLATSADRDVVRVNNDTLYILSWLDLRRQPRIIEVPAAPDGRYFVVQLVDLFTYNFGYLGTRTTGNTGGRFLVAGPHWAGPVPFDVDKSYRSNSDFVFALGRVAVNGGDDLPAARTFEERFRIVPLSDTTSSSTELTAALPSIDPKREATIYFIDTLNHLLSLVEPYDGDAIHIDRWSAIGIGAGRRFDAATYPPDMRAEIEDGIADAVAEIEAKSLRLGTERNRWTLTAGIFGSRDVIGQDYLLRAAAAKYAIFGNDLDEAFYPSTESDADGNPLDASKHDYVITFAPDQLPPVNAFWSVTMYGMPDQMLVENAIGRYSIGNRTAGLGYGQDGSLTITISHLPPSGDALANWLPAPNGPFSLTTRLYMPKPEALEPLYAPPPISVRRP